MNVSRSVLEQVYLDIVNSVGYRTTVGPVDKAKVEQRLAGVATKTPSARLARAAWRTAGLLTPLTPPPPPPPPTHTKVAPRVAYKDGGSDARYCTINQPGVTQDPGAPTGHTFDEHGATYDDNGLCKNGLRSDGSRADCPTSAREIDGRPYCSLPTAGDPTTNTGSWLI